MALTARRSRKNQERAARGAALLDEKVPGWHRKVKITQLDQGNGSYNDLKDCGCVLAQLDYGVKVKGDDWRSWTSGYWERMAERIGVTGPKSWVAFGFTTGREAGGESEDEFYTDLTEHWKNEIRSRRKS